jgi:hypothetical protein
MEHAFSIEMKSKSNVKSISISEKAHDQVLFEGNLGELLYLSFTEDDVLELVGVEGVLRVDLLEEQLSEALEAHRRSGLSAEERRSKNTQTMKVGK